MCAASVGFRHTRSFIAFVAGSPASSKYTTISRYSSFAASTASSIEPAANSVGGSARCNSGVPGCPNATPPPAAITAARAAGLLVIALATPTDPADIVDITFATDNFVAGQAIGQWAAGKLDGAKAVIARLIITDAVALTVDYKRDNGFLDGMGIAISCTLLALVLPMHSLEPFLLLLSSVFVPLYGVILGRLGFGVPGLTPAQRAVEPVAVGLWIAGIALYHGVERFGQIEPGV